MCVLVCVCVAIFSLSLWWKCDCFSSSAEQRRQCDRSAHDFCLQLHTNTHYGDEDDDGDEDDGDDDEGVQC